ncbi:Oidioi.mRNA.OKI2018_I69.chr1.g1768.t1.cds [Oikopleura dioica]|uniref:Oidioi.mRNA.OKI2018_I69.chr1.g1768.t1.cds n=1 Tax=Oikopleura dioica TaxID=34765 RepID=A0ABN7SVX0_OIKDI|nr:Oidioi.mRNA.OKI2018_I69.chr1.g1768.t1.cds [Oikopleura dioica]
MFANFSITKKFQVSISGKEISALIGEAETYDEAKLFCESKNAHIPTEKLEFPNNTSHDYWIEVDDKNEVRDPQLLEAMELFEKVSSHENVTVSLMTNKNCLFVIDNIQPLIWKNFDQEKLNHQRSFAQYICEKDVFDDQNRVKIINDYKVDCKLLQLNSTFLEEHQLWDYQFENKTWITENRKLYISPVLSAPFSKQIGYEFDKNLHNLTGFPWCPGQPAQPQGILWSTFEFLVVDGTSHAKCIGLMSFTAYEKITAASSKMKELAEDIFSTFPISTTVRVIVSGKETRALIGETMHIKEAKVFCEENNAHFPHEIVEFPNNIRHDYWIEVADENLVKDSRLLEALKRLKEISMHDNATVSISVAQWYESKDDTCIYLEENINSKYSSFDIRRNDHQYVCKNDVFDDENRVKIVNDYKVNCEQLKINSTFFEEFHLWNYLYENKTWIVDNRKLLGEFHNNGIISVRSRQIGYQFEEDLPNKSGFPWCQGQPDTPQGIMWSDGEFIVVHGSSKADRHHQEKVQYNEAKAICEAENATLPYSPFRVIESDHSYGSIFWVHENEESRAASEDNNRKNLSVEYVGGGVTKCAILRSDLANPNVPDAFICADEIYDELGRIIIQKNLTIGCPILKLTFSFLREQKIDNGYYGEHVIIRNLSNKKTPITSIMSGFTRADYSKKETGIKWCSGQPVELTPGRRMRELDHQIIGGYSYSTAATLCLPKNYQSLNSSFTELE